MQFKPSLFFGFVTLLVGVSTSSAGEAAAIATKADFTRDIAPLLKTHCFKCHSGDEPEGDFRLEFESGEEFVARAAKNRPMFQKMSEVLRDREMPPKNRHAARGCRARAADRLDRPRASGAQPQRPAQSGHVAAIRRLSNVEYANTVRDLLDLSNFKVADDFPADNFANGFDNMADVLTYSTSHMEHYLGAAEEAIRLLDGTAVVGHNWDKNYFEPAGKSFDASANSVSATTTTSIAYACCSKIFSPAPTVAP